MAFDPRKWEEYVRKHPEAAKMLDEAYEKTRRLEEGIDAIGAAQSRMNRLIDQGVTDFTRLEAGPARINDFMLKNIDLQEKIRSELGLQFETYKDLSDTIESMPSQERMMVEGKILNLHHRLLQAQREGVEIQGKSYQEYLKRMDLVRKATPGLARWEAEPARYWDAQAYQMKRGGDHWTDLWRRFRSEVATSVSSLSYLPPRFRSMQDASMAYLKAAGGGLSRFVIRALNAQEATEGLIDKWAEDYAKAAQGPSTAWKSVEDAMAFMKKISPEDRVRAFKAITDAVSSGAAGATKAFKQLYPALKPMIEAVPTEQAGIWNWLTTKFPKSEFERANKFIGFLRNQQMITAESATHLKQEMGMLGTKMLQAGAGAKLMSDQLTFAELAEAAISKRAAEANKELGEETEIDKRKIGVLDLLSRSFLKLGRRIGFYGWILSYAGRSTLVMFRQIWTALRNTIQVGVDWVSTLDQMATSLALMQAAGIEAATAEDVLGEGIDRLIESGLEIQATWSAIQGVFSAIALLFSEELQPYLETFLEQLARIAASEEFQLFIAAVAEFIGTKLLPAILEIIEAFEAWWPVIEPILGFFIDLLATLAPIIPLLVTFGTLMWIAGPALTAVGAALSLVNAMLIAKSIATAADTGLTFSQTAAHYGLLPALLAVNVAGHSLIFWLGIAAAAIIVVVLAILAMTGHLDDFVKAFQTMWDTATKGWGEIADSTDQATEATEDFTNAQEMMGREMEDLYGHSIGTDIAHNMADAVRALRSARREFGGAGPGLGITGVGEGGTQHISVYAPITIGSVSSEFTPEDVEMAVNRGIGDALRRKGR